MVLAIYGASGLGSEFINTANEINANKRWEKFIFVDDDPEKTGTSRAGLEIFSLDNAIKKYGKDSLEFIIAIGEIEVKEKVFRKLDSLGCIITNLVNPFTKLSEYCELGRGVVIKEHVIMPYEIKIGNNVLIQARAGVAHNNEIGDNTVISSNTFIGGDTIIGKNCYIAPCACIRNGVHIGDNVIVGMAAVVT